MFTSECSKWIDPIKSNYINGLQSIPLCNSATSSLLRCPSPANVTGAIIKSSTHQLAHRARGDAAHPDTVFPCRMERGGALHKGCKMILQRIAAGSCATETSAIMTTASRRTAADALMANYEQGGNHQSFSFYSCDQPPSFLRLQFQQKQDHPRLPARRSSAAGRVGFPAPGAAQGIAPLCLSRGCIERTEWM